MGTEEHDEPTVSDVLARRLRELRHERALSAKALSERVSDLGGTLSRGAIARIEAQDAAQRRSVDVAELLLLAAALHVSPTDLLLPPDRQPIQVTPTVTSSSVELRRWIEGDEPVSWDVQVDAWQWSPDRHERLLSFHRAKPRREYLIWQANHPAVAAAEQLVRQCGDLSIREVDPFFYDFEPALGYIELYRAVAVLLRHLGPVMERLEDAANEKAQRQGRSTAGLAPPPDWLSSQRGRPGRVVLPNDGGEG